MHRLRLPDCRFRGAALPDDRHECSHPAFNWTRAGAPDGWCMSCHMRLKEVPGRSPIYAPTAGAIRHLAYHVFPRGPAWRENIRLLRARLSVFNGARLVAVAVDCDTDSVADVAGELGQDAAEYLEIPNDRTMREMGTYPTLMRRMAAHRGPLDVHWYGHAKGIDSERLHPAVRLWREAMYEAQLDHVPLMTALLERYAAVGQFLRSRHIVAGTTCAWHFSGSYCWRRSADMFARNWDAYDPCWCGSESHPGRILDQSEVHCLYGRVCEAGLGLYLKEVWDGGMSDERLSWLAEAAPYKRQPLLLTVVLTAARQRDLVHQAIASVQAQTSSEWELLILDAGELGDEGAYERYASDGRIRVKATGETAADRAEFCMQGWAINAAFKRGLPRGDLILHLSDDDVLDPGAVAALVNRARTQPDEQAWYGPAERVAVMPDGEVRSIDRLETHGVLSINHAGINRTDGMQVCCRRSVWKAWPERKHMGPVADGAWMDTVAIAAPIVPIPELIGTHRLTPLSTFTTHQAIDRLRGPG